jgi:hypothetical protein
MITDGCLLESESCGRSYRGKMKTRGSCAVALALIVAALSAFAGTCDLRCASIEGAPGHPEKVFSPAMGSSTQSASCPLHAARKADSDPFSSPSPPCHGKRNGGGGAILVVTSAAPLPAGSGQFPALQASPVSQSARADATPLRSAALASGRMLRFPALPSILRL